MKQKKTKLFILVPIGLLWNSCVLLASHSIAMPDFIKGSLMGVGIGIMLMALVLKRLKGETAK